MDNDGFVSDSIPADLGKSWHIPRPTLARSSKSSQGSTSSNSTESVRSGSLLLTAASLAQIHQAPPPGRQDEAPPPAARATRDANIRYYLEGVAGKVGGQAPPPLAAGDGKRGGAAGAAAADDDAASVASSTHFTVVNVGRSRPPPRRGFCRRHQLTVLVLSMSALFTVGILTAILLLEMRAKNQRY